MPQARPPVCAATLPNAEGCNLPPADGQQQTFYLRVSGSNTQNFTADIAAAIRQVEASLALERGLRTHQREFFATVSHELRTPLAVIDASAQNLALTQQALQGATRARVDKILAAVQRRAELLNRQLRREPDADPAPKVNLQ